MAAELSLPGHGGEALRVARETGLPVSRILDFSASINPLGLPPEVRQAATAALDDCIHYPEAHGESLIDALAARHRIAPDRVLVGNGSTELIYLLPRVLRPRRAAIVTPAFSEYERSLAQVGCTVVTIPLSPHDGFHFDPQRVAAALPGDVELLWLANPGNPSGALITGAALHSLLELLPQRVQVVLDEAFIDFTPEVSCVEFAAAYPQLIILRSLTKFYAIPGLRVGYLVASPALVRRLRDAQPPWSLATPALAAAKACLSCDAYRQQTLALIPQWRQALARELAATGCQVFPAAANYLLVRLPDGGLDAGLLAENLRTQGLLIRNCANFLPLDARFMRVAVKTPEENMRLVRALRS